MYFDISAYSVCYQSKMRVVQTRPLVYSNRISCVLVGAGVQPLFYYLNTSLAAIVIQLSAFLGFPRLEGVDLGLALRPLRVMIGFY